MGSRLVTFRMPEDLYEEFQQKCSDDGVTVSQRLRGFIDDSIYPGNKPQATVDEVDKAEEPDTNRLYYLEEKIEQFDEVMVSILERLGRIEEAVGISSEEKDKTINNPDQKPQWPLSIFSK